MEKKKILVVDDEKDFLSIVKLNLEATGKYQVFTLDGAADIITQVHNILPDLILLDMLMPVIEGVDACTMLNNDAVGSAIPIIIISSLESEADKIQAYKKGILDYVVKPVRAYYQDRKSPGIKQTRLCRLKTRTARLA